MVVVGEDEAVPVVVHDDAGDEVFDDDDGDDDGNHDSDVHGCGMIMA